MWRRYVDPNLRGRVYQIFAGLAESNYIKEFDRIALSFEVNAQSVK